MTSNRSLLDRYSQKFDGNISDKAKFEPSENIHSACVGRGRSIAGSINCKANE